MPSKVNFYGSLQRRDPYETKSTGGFYGYAHYRTAIAEDCRSHCVYCDCHEDCIGGREGMETDHFRPWNKKFGPAEERKFSHLKNEPSNLVHACAVCNGFKSDHWPTEDPAIPYDHEKGWVEPFIEARADFLRVREDGVVESLKAPGEYIIRLLRLNRPFLTRLRRNLIQGGKLLVWLDTYRSEVQATIEAQPGTASAQKAEDTLEVLTSIKQLISEFTIVPEGVI